MKTVNKRVLDHIFKYIVLLCTCISILALSAIVFYIITNALPLFEEVQIFEFITKDIWAPSDEQYGILPFIIATILTTACALLFAIPLGLYTSIFISDIANKHSSKIMIFVVEILASIPSVIYGFFGLSMIVPKIQMLFNLKSGSTIISASIVLGLMILPTIVSLSASSLMSVPKTIEEASLALGASKMQTIFKTKIRYAKSGIITSILLASSRAIGETMAVVLVIGNSVMIPGLLDSGRTLSGNIVIELAYATGLQKSALFASGLILLLFVTVINTFAMYMQNKGVYKS